MTEPPTTDATNAVVAICVLLVPAAGVGAVGVPVKDGEAIVALNAMSLVFVVMLAVFAVTLVSNEVILAVFEATFVCSVVILAVFDVIALVLEVILAVFVATFVCSDVILAVFEAITLVLEVILAVFVAILFVLSVIAELLAVILTVLLAIEFVFEVILAVLASTFVCNVVMLEVFEAIALVLDVILKVFAVTFVCKEVILAVLLAINVGSVEIVTELTPPTLFTIGEEAVPLKSPVNFNLPFVVASASGVSLFVMLDKTNCVVATCVVFVPVAAVGAVGVPVKEGEAMVALKAISLVLVVMLDVFAITRDSNEVILEVFAATFV